MIFSPLEQFTIIKLISFRLINLDLSFTNSSLWMCICCLFCTFFFLFAFSQAKLIPQNWFSFWQILYEFILFNILTENVKGNQNKFFPFIFTLFIFIFSCNIIGMIPYCFTATSHLCITLGLAITAFLAINIIGIQKHGFHIFCLFLPSGAPLILAPLLVMIEFVSYCFRVISLALRLFANMMSGHCLLKILAGFAWTMLSAGKILFLLHILPLLVIFAIIGLELAIAFLQAYVFTVLFCIYLNDAINLH